MDNKQFKNNIQLPQLLELEYSFKSGGHNSLKLVDGRLFFFSEADSHLTEKNEYLTMVSIPDEIKWKQFWDELNQCGIWDWDECRWPGEAEEDSSCEEDHEEEHCHCEDDNCDHDSVINENIHKDENIPEEDLSNEDDDSSEEDILQNIPIEGDIWQLKIIKDNHRISCKSWCLKEKSTDEFFQAMGKLAGVNITEPFGDLSKRLTVN
ncbi:hypothetical protein [uncultured Methanobacterium sp.]|uniref:hypothetical protein n=1 Tax=uncultured Methanobacterium sp. TaxID=176306 RepID=UPI002AA76DE0|nr:hypothetical protein [uncultured Methanobacterium sp.]